MANNTIKKVKIQKAKASDMLLLAAITFFSQLVEPIFHYLIVWTPLIDNVPLTDMWWTLILRLLCCASWGLTVYLIVIVSRNNGFDPIKINGKPTNLQWVMTAAVTFVFVAVMVILDGGIKETLLGLIELNSAVYTVTRFIFWAFQVAVIVLVLSLGQKFGDLLMKKGNEFVPFGGIVLGLCTVLVNVVTGGFSLNTAIMFGIQVIYGMVFVCSGKRALVAAPFIYIMFLVM